MLNSVNIFKIPRHENC